MTTSVEHDRDLFDILTDSSSRVVGWPLIATGRGPAWLYENAPFAAVARNTDPDPRFIYANRTAQRLFEYDWNEIRSPPSRPSAQAVDRAERQRLLEQVACDGSIGNYSGIPTARSGRLFRIEKAVVWQLVDEKGLGRSQDAAFGLWTDIDED